MTEEFKGPETLALHAGHEPDSASLARAAPIHQTTSRVFRDTEHPAGWDRNAEAAGRA